MEKIFDEDVKSYLISLGMENIDIEKLRKKKLKESAISVLNEVIEAIKSNDINSIEKYLELSPAGDGHGEDNTYINFGKIAGDDLDIRNLFFQLNQDEYNGGHKPWPL